MVGRAMALAGCLGWVAEVAVATPVDVGGYFRVAARPDFQGGDGALGYWNLYGRLMNERSYGLLDLRLRVLEAEPGSGDPWTTVHARIEGGTIGGADAGNGVLSGLRLSQVYVRAGNVGPKGITWQIGSLDWYLGDLGLYDFRPANIFFESVGVSARLDTSAPLTSRRCARPGAAGCTRGLEVVAGIGDAGFFLRPDRYNTILTPGGTVRARFGPVEVGGGGQLYVEPRVIGKPTSLYATPGVAYEDFVRGEVAERWIEQNPGAADLFPDPEPRGATSYKVFGYLGFGGFGPVTWNNLFVSARRLHPGGVVREQFDGETFDIYTADLTDERTVLEIGDELQLRVVPRRFDLVWAMYAAHWADGDNDIAPTDFDRTVASTVIRGQVYLTPTVHVLAESSVATERSTNGNAYRNSRDSIFQNTDGQPDTDGLEYGDADRRDTVQLKGGLVLNPLGPGIFARPSLRLLWGSQYATQNNAFGNSFVVTPDQNADFETVERHWHHLVSLETEVWF